MCTWARVTCAIVRIAQVAPVWFPVPPAGYGGIELVVALLTDGLVDQGYDVTLFASGGSRSKARIISPLAEPPDPRKLGVPWYDAYHALAAYLHDSEFDVIHDHAGVVGPVLGALLRGKPPVIHTLHGPWTEETRLLYELVGQHINLVAISDAQRRDGGDIRHLGTVYNGIDLSEFTFRANPGGDYLLYLGRFHPEKGVHLAVQVARQARLPLVISGIHQDLEYWRNQVEPFVDGERVRFVGPADREQRDALMGNALACLNLVTRPERFGLTIVESLACGTPVIAMDLGSPREILGDGISGFLVSSVEEAVAAVRRVPTLDRAACRRWVERRFTVDHMVEGYLRVYERLLA